MLEIENDSHENHSASKDGGDDSTVDSWETREIKTQRYSHLNHALDKSPGARHHDFPEDQLAIFIPVISFRKIVPIFFLGYDVTVEVKNHTH